MLKLKSTGLSESTIKRTDERLNYLGRNTDLTKPEEVKTFIAQMKQANSYKQCIVKVYNYFAITNGIQWIKPTYKYERKIPLIPTTENVNKIIATEQQAQMSQSHPQN